MGAFYSMIFDTEFHTFFNTGVTNYDELGSEVPSNIPFTTGETFQNLSNFPEIIKKINSIEKENINVPIELMDEFMTDLADFIDHYIDLSKMGGKYSKLWKGYTHHDIKEERVAEIKKYIQKIIEVDTSSEKEDKTLGVYLKKIITHIMGDECGGFELVDDREIKTNPTIRYMHENKMENMNQFITSHLNGDTPGFIFSTEHDWESCLKDTDTSIKFHQFNPLIHKDNSAKALYYTDGLKVVELDDNAIKRHLNGIDYSNYLEKFVIFTVKDPKAKVGQLFYDEVYVIGLHCKSMGSKNDIKRNLGEYKFIKLLNERFSDKNSMFIGDFNVPVFNEGQAYFGLDAEDVIYYPLQDYYNVFEKRESFMMDGYNRLTNYSLDSVAEKERTGDSGKNSQSVLGKCFKRSYNVQHGYGKFDIDIASSCTLYPQIEKVPYISGKKETDWLSDHQAAVIILTDSHMNQFKTISYNVLSKTCSGGQPFKVSLTNEQVNNARDEFYEIMSELCNYIVDNISE